MGELHDADPSWKHILDKIRSTCPDLTNPDCHKLVSGQAFLRGISKSNWRLHGLSWQFPEGGLISWRRPHNTDGAIIRLRTIRSVEIRGVPFGYLKWQQLELLLQPVGDLRKIVCNGLQNGDPTACAWTWRWRSTRRSRRNFWQRRAGGQLQSSGWLFYRPLSLSQRRLQAPTQQRARHILWHWHKLRRVGGSTRLSSRPVACHQASLGGDRKPPMSYPKR